MRLAKLVVPMLLLAFSPLAGAQDEGKPESPAWSDCDDLDAQDVQLYDPATPVPFEGYWLSNRAARCVLGEAEACERMLAFGEDLRADLTAAISSAGVDIDAALKEDDPASRWLDDNRLWLCVGIVTGAAAVVLGGWTVAKVAQ